MSLTGLTVLLVAIGVLMVAALVGLVVVFVLDRDDESSMPPARKKSTASPAGSKPISPTTSVGASVVKKSTAPAVAKKVSPTAPEKAGIPKKPAAARHSVGTRVRIVNRPGYEGRIGKIIGIGPLYLKLRMEDDGDVLIVGQVNAVPARDTQRVGSGAPPTKPVVEVKPKPAPSVPPAKASPPGKVVAAKGVAKPSSTKATPAATKNAAAPKRNVAQKGASPVAKEGPVLGWYADPGGSGGHRYWNGTAWTEYRAVSVTTGIPPTTSLDSAPIERGSSRWLIGRAMLIVAVVLVIASCMEWAQLSYAASDGSHGQLKVSATLDGIGSVSVAVPGVKDSAERNFVERQEANALEAEDPGAPGIPFLIVGLMIAGASWLFLSNRRRQASVITIIALSSVLLIVGLWHIANVREMFNDPPGWNAAHYSPGFGLIAAILTAVALVGLSVTALVLERRAVSSSPA